MPVGAEGRLPLYGDCLGNRCGAGDGNYLFSGAEFGILVDRRHKVGVSAGKSVLAYIETCQLIFGVGTQEVQLFKKTEKQEHGNACPRSDRDEAEKLDAQLCKVSRIEQAAQTCGRVGICQKSHRDRSPDAVGAVDAYRTDGIVDMQLEVQGFNNDYDKNTGYDTDDCRADSVIGVTARGHRNKTCKRRVQAHGNVWFAVFKPRI